jgi:hypothetical protein
MPEKTRKEVLPGRIETVLTGNGQIDKFEKTGDEGE